MAVSQGAAVQLSFGLPDAWAQAFLLPPAAKAAFARLAASSRLLPHELLTALVDEGFAFAAVRTSGLVAAWLKRAQLTKPAQLFVDFAREELSGKH